MFATRFGVTRSMTSGDIRHFAALIVEPQFAKAPLASSLWCEQSCSADGSRRARVRRTAATCAGGARSDLLISRRSAMAICLTASACPASLRHDMRHVDDGSHAAVTIPGWRSSWLSTVVWPAPKRALSRVTAIRRSMSREDVRRSERRAGISVVRGARTSGHGRVAQGDSFADQVVARLAVELAPSFAGVATRGALPSATVAIRKSGRKGGKQGGGSGRLSAPFRVGMAFAGNPGNARMPVCLRGLCQGGESVSRAVSRCPAPSWHRPP